MFSLPVDPSGQCHPPLRDLSPVGDPLFESGSELRTIRSLAGFQVTTDQHQPRLCGLQARNQRGNVAAHLDRIRQIADLPFEILRLHFEGGAVDVRGNEDSVQDHLNERGRQHFTLDDGEHAVVGVVNRQGEGVGAHR